MPTAWPDRNQKAPNYWDLQLKAWIEEAPTVAGNFRNALDARIQEVSPSTDISGKADLVGGKVPASQLPSYVDDVLEFANQAGFPSVGETSKLYVALDTNLLYRWSGSAYVNITAAGLALGETSTTAYRGDRGKTAYDHSQTTGNPHSTAVADISGLQTTLNGLAAKPITGVTLVQQFIFTDPTIARPAVPSYVSLNWVGPAGSGGAAPTNLATGDTWDLQTP